VQWKLGSEKAVAVRERAGTGPLLLVKVREDMRWRVDQRNLERRNVGFGSFAGRLLVMSVRNGWTGLTETDGEGIFAI
jgi:hypothetical protein